MKIHYATLYDNVTNDTAHEDLIHMEEDIDTAIEKDIEMLKEDEPDIEISKEDYYVVAEVEMTIEEYKEFAKNNS